MHPTLPVSEETPKQHYETFSKRYNNNEISLSTWFFDNYYLTEYTTLGELYRGSKPAFLEQWYWRKRCICLIKAQRMLNGLKLHVAAETIKGAVTFDELANLTRAVIHQHRKFDPPCLLDEAIFFLEVYGSLLHSEFLKLLENFVISRCDAAAHMFKPKTSVKKETAAEKEQVNEI